MAAAQQKFGWGEKKRKTDRIIGLAKGVYTSHWQESALKWIWERCLGEAVGPRMAASVQKK